MARRNAISDLRGAGRLAAELTAELTDVVEQMHATIAQFALPVGRVRPRRTWGLTRFTYACIKASATWLGRGWDAGLEPIESLRPSAEPEAWRNAAVAVLNGVLGDRLEATGNPLATQATLVGLDQPGGDATLVLVHGLCMDEAAWGPAWFRMATDAGYGTLRFRYNSGRAIAENGRSLSQLLERHLPPDGPVVLVGHSMGGLVARAAAASAERAEHGWRSRLTQLITLGTPHLGAPLERGGQWLAGVTQWSPYSAPIIDWLDRRSEGMHDLAHGQGAPSLPHGVDCYAVAATLQAGPFVGDGLVPLDSALGRHADPARGLGFRDTWVGAMSHNALLTEPEVRAVVRAWLASTSVPKK